MKTNTQNTIIPLLSLLTGFSYVLMAIGTFSIIAKNINPSSSPNDEISSFLLKKPTIYGEIGTGLAVLLATIVAVIAPSYRSIPNEQQRPISNNPNSLFNSTRSRNLCSCARPRALEFCLAEVLCSGLALFGIAQAASSVEHAQKIIDSLYTSSSSYDYDSLAFNIRTSRHLIGFACVFIAAAFGILASSVCEPDSNRFKPELINGEVRPLLANFPEGGFSVTTAATSIQEIKPPVAPRGNVVPVPLQQEQPHQQQEQSSDAVELFSPPAPAASM